MPLQPSRRDNDDTRAIIRHHQSYLDGLDPGYLGGRFATPQQVAPGPSELVGGDEGGDGDGETIVGEDGDRLVLTNLNTQVWRLSAEPISETLVVRWHPDAGAGVEWKRGEHYTIDDDDSLVTITAASLAAGAALVGDVFSAQYLRSDTAESPAPEILIPEEASSTTDTTPPISGTSAGSRPIEVFVDGSSVGTTTATADGTWAITSTSLALGAHIAVATQTNPDGSTIDSPPVDFAITSPSPATATLRAGRTDHGDNGPSLTSLALPTGTVIGDLIVVQGTDIVTVTDARLTAIGSYMWIGFATDLSAIQATAPGGLGNFWSIACITLDTDAVGWTTASITSDGSMVNGDTLDIAALSSIAVTVCGIWNYHSVVHGNCSLPTGYTTGATAVNGGFHAQVAFWTNPTLSTSPIGPTQFGGGNGGALATVIGLIGP